MAAVSFLIDSVIPPCEGDSCMGGERLLFTLCAVPFVLFIALVVGLLAARVARVWGMTLCAMPVALLALGAFVVVLLLEDLEMSAMAPVLGVAVGPTAMITAGLMREGRGWVRFGAMPAIVVLIVGPLVVDHTVLIPLRQARAITRTVTQPYRLTGSAMTLVSLNLNPNARALELQFNPDGGASGEIQLSEGRSLTPFDSKARCAPQMSDTDIPNRACVVVPAVAPNLAIWRTGLDPLDQVVVVRADAVIKIDGVDASTDAAALALAARLGPASAVDLLHEAKNTYVPN